MKKIILYALAAIGFLFVLSLARSFWGGFSSTINPSKALEKAKCVSECNKNKMSNNCPQYCANK